MPKLNIFVIHYDKLKSRKTTLIKLESLKNDIDMDINIKVISDHEPETLSMNNIKNLIAIENIPEDGNKFYQNFVRPMGIPNISNSLKHFKAYQEILKTEKEDTNIILEDDVIFSDRIYHQLKNLINHIKSIEWDIFYLGQPSEGPPNTTPERFDVTEIQPENLILPCCDSYVISHDCAKKMLTAFFPIRFMQNIHLGYLTDKLKLKTYKLFPNITGDGSKIGNFNSTLNVNNVLLFNQMYKDIYMKLEKNPVINDMDYKEMEDKFKNNQFKDNADLIYLEGLMYMKRNEMDKAEKLFERALKLYEDSNCILNNTSIFLKNYINLYRFTQKLI